MSSGSRTTTTYVARGSMTTPSSGVWVLTTRRPGWASRRENSTSSGSVSQSTHGESSPRGAGSAGEPCTNERQICCTQVVPLLERVLTTTSPSRNGNRRHRSLSSSEDR